MALRHWKQSSNATLFERIRALDNSESSRSEMTLVNSIKSHLNDILNARPGTTPSALALGVIDLNDAVTHRVDLNSKICEEIVNCILTYEPRITEVDVRPMNIENDPLSLAFSVKAIVNVSNKIEELNFNINLEQSIYYRLGY